jgi:hypothetical protein
VPDAQHLREQANKCLETARNSTNPELIEQLELWAAELHFIADTVERNPLMDHESHEA